LGRLPGPTGIENIPELPCFDFSKIIVRKESTRAGRIFNGAIRRRVSSGRISRSTPPWRNTLIRLMFILDVVGSRKAAYTGSHFRCVKGRILSTGWWMRSWNASQAKPRNIPPSRRASRNSTLLVHYDKAFLYNTPVKGSDVGYEEAVSATAAKIGNAVGIFHRIFVYVPVADGKKAFQLYP
jgi:hypothetical protein